MSDLHWTLLNLLAKNNLQDAEILLNHNVLDINAPIMNGQRIIERIVGYHQLDAIKFLLVHGAEFPPVLNSNALAHFILSLKDKAKEYKIEFLKTVEAAGANLKTIYGRGDYAILEALSEAELIEMGIIITAEDKAKAKINYLVTTQKELKADIESHHHYFDRYTDVGSLPDAGYKDLYGALNGWEYIIKDLKQIDKNQLLKFFIAEGGDAYIKDEDGNFVILKHFSIEELNQVGINISVIEVANARLEKLQANLQKTIPLDNRSYFKALEETLRLSKDSEDRSAILKTFISAGMDVQAQDEYGNFYIFNIFSIQEVQGLGANFPYQNMIQAEVAKFAGFNKEPLVVIEDANKPHNSLEWIEARTFVNEDPSFEFSATYIFESHVVPGYIKLTRGANSVMKDRIPELLNSIPQHNIINKIFKIAALEFLAGMNYLLVPNSVSEISDHEDDSGGYASPPSANRIASTMVATKLLDQQFKLTFTHELSHHVMRILFNNDFKPYFSYDVKAKAAYESAILNTLVKIYQYWFNEATISANNFSSSWELGQLVLNEINNELDFYANSVLIGFPIRFLSYLKEDIEHVNRDMGSIIKGWWNGKSLSESLFIKDHILSLLSVYDLKYYDADSEHCEVIVHYPEALTFEIPHELSSVFSPLHDYFVEYIVPEMDKYLAQHEFTYLVF